MKKFVSMLALLLSLVLLMGSVAFAEATTVVVGTNPEFPPFEFVGDDGQIAGIDPDIIRAIFAKVDPAIEVKIEAMSFDALIPALGSGKIDIAIAGMSVTEERKQSVLFSDFYFDATQVIIVKAEGATIAGEADLEGKKIGVQLGTTGDLYVTDKFKTAEIARFDKGIDAVQDVLAGRLDAVVIDEGPANAFVAQSQGLVVLPDRMSEEKYAIALKKDAVELQEKINVALAALKEDGTIQAIIDKY